MTVAEHLLIKLAEECGEVAKECHKAALFGTHDTSPLDPSGKTNVDKIADELNDLVGIVSLLIEAGILPADWQNEEAINAKRIKVGKWMKYAADKGKLI